jgi:catechol-2,3-dioxygenase
MPVTGFSHYNLRAPRDRLDELRRFYCEVVGLEVGERPALQSFGWWLYAGGRAVLHLSEARPGEERPAGVVSTFDHAAFSCTDRPAHERLLQARGVRYRSVPVPATRQVQLFFADPAGNGVELNFDEPDGPPPAGR